MGTAHIYWRLGYGSLFLLSALFNTCNPEVVLIDVGCPIDSSQRSLHLEAKVQKSKS